MLYNRRINLYKDIASFIVKNDGEIENIVEEAKSLAANGIKELIVVAQDTTRYGIDLYGELKLPVLLKELCKISSIPISLSGLNHRLKKIIEIYENEQ